MLICLFGDDYFKVGVVTVLGFVISCDLLAWWRVSCCVAWLVVGGVPLGVCWVFGLLFVGVVLLLVDVGYWCSGVFVC